MDMNLNLIEDDPADVAARVARLLATVPAPADLDLLAVFAAELAERIALLATLPAAPGDTAATYLEHRAEALELVESIAAGLQRMELPE
jgi:hypothetical protein